MSYRRRLLCWLGWHKENEWEFCDYCHCRVWEDGENMIRAWIRRWLGIAPTKKTDPLSWRFRLSIEDKLDLQHEWNSKLEDRIKVLESAEKL